MKLRIKLQGQDQFCFIPVKRELWEWRNMLKFILCITIVFQTAKIIVKLDLNFI